MWGKTNERNDSQGGPKQIHTLSFLSSPGENERHILFSQLILYIIGVLFHLYTTDASSICFIHDENFSEKE